MTAIGDLAALVHRETGIRLNKTQHAALQAALDRVTPGTDPMWFLQRLLDPAGGRELLTRLIDEVTVKETFFLRDPDQLSRIGWHLLLDQARSSGADSIRVWCAGCATGEEAYTLALLAAEAFAPARAPVSILATDISRSALVAARDGSYRPRSVRELGEQLRRRHFSEEGERLVVGDRLREHVTFLQHNLVRDAVPPLGEDPFHLILCRNVLIYFDPQTVERVVEGLEQSLAPGGMLVLGAADALCGSAGRLKSMAAPAPASPPAKPRRRKRPDEDARSTRSLESVAPPTAARDRLDEVDCFLTGLAELERGDNAAAVDSFRKALYADPGFGLAAFKLGRAHDVLGNGDAARRAYEQALRTLDAVSDRHEPLFGQVDPADVAAAARARLEALVSVGIGVRRSNGLE